MVEEQSASSKPAGMGGSGDAGSAEGGGTASAGSAERGGSAGAGSATGGRGGVSGTGAAAGRDAHALEYCKGNPPEVVPTCDEGAADRLDPAGWCLKGIGVQPTPDGLLENFEDGDELSLYAGSGLGRWYTQHGNGKQFPSPCLALQPTELSFSSNQLMLRTYGHYYAYGYAEVGLRLRASAVGCKQPFVATGFSRVRFLAKGVGQIRFAVDTSPVVPVELGGECSGPSCSDPHGVLLDLRRDWQFYSVDFAELRQERAESATPLRLDQVLGLRWSSRNPAGRDIPDGCFDYSIDEIHLIPE